MMLVTALVVALLVGQASEASELRVCPQGCPYRLPSAAVAAARSGDVVRVAAATYTDCLVVPPQLSDLQIIGEPGAAMTGKICQQKALLVNSGTNTTLRGLELFGVHSVADGGNVAGVRHQGTNLTMIGMHLHDNDDGILTSANPSRPDFLLFDSCLFERNGWNAASGMAHNMYIGHATRFTLRNSTTRATKRGGHLLKSRAVETRVEGCVLASLDGDSSREMDIPEGGIVHIQDSVMEKGPSSQNPEVVGYLAEEYDPSRRHSFVMRNTILINDQGKSDDVFVHFFRPARDGRNISGNTLVGKGTDVESMRELGNAAFATREAAGLGAYPSLPPLPPDSCGAALAELCGGSRWVGGCAVCCGRQQHALRMAGCSAARCSSFCDR